jgi:hypothetical protein
MGNPKNSTLKLNFDGNRPLKLFKIEGTKEVLAEMYFQRIVHNQRCWYKNPTHHYTVFNDNFHEGALSTARDDVKNTVTKKIEAYFVEKDGSQNIESAVANLISWSKELVAFLRTIPLEVFHENTHLQLLRKMEWAIDDVEEWIAGIEEQGSGYFNRYVGGR